MRVWTLAGKIKQMIDKIVAERSNGEPLLAAVTETKLVLKGVDPKKYTAISEDDREIIGKLREIAKDLGVTV